MDVWILAGQSNMQGAAPYADGVDIEPDPRVEVLSSAGEWSDAREPLHRLWRSYTPVNQDLLRAAMPEESRGLPLDELEERDIWTPHVGLGLGPAFATALADATGERIGLIPCAHGGTTLEQWSPGPEPESTGTLYGAMLDRVARASSRDDARIAGLVWYQGESDATPERAPDYAARLDTWIARVRADLGDATLPVVVVQLGRFAGDPQIGELDERSWDAIREAQRTTPERSPQVAVVSAVDLELSDPIHIGAHGLERLGQRIAAVASEHRSGPDVIGIERAAWWTNGHLLIRVRCRDVRGEWTGGRLRGFELCGASGAPRRDVRVVDAHADPEDPTCIRIVTSALELEELDGVHLAYGRGFDPPCDAVDYADQALPAFVARPIRDEFA